MNITLRKGEFVAAMGPSGSGKTTLLNLIGGLDKPSEGSVWVFGLDVASASVSALAELRLRSVGYVFQNVNLLPDLTLEENVVLPLRAAGVRREAAKRMAVQRLHDVGLSSHRSRRPAEVSGGERQRAAIARATVGRRSLLLADEPTGALDSDTGRTVVSVIRSLCTSGVTALVSTHNPEVAAAADRTVMFCNGALMR